MRAPRRVLVAIAAFLTVTVVVASAPHRWLCRFSIGPVEMLWRAANVGVRDRPTSASRVQD